MDYTLNYKITADDKQATAVFKGVDKNLQKISGSTLVDFQKGLKGAASEASNLVGVFTGNRLTGAASQLTSLAGAVSAFPGPAGLAVGAAAALSASFLGLGTVFYQITKSTSDFGSEVHDLAEKTGLTTETISSLKIAADQSGSSIEEVSKGLTRFTLLMGEAAKGSTDAKEKLKALHVTSTDLDTGLAQVVETIYKLPPGIQQNLAASDVFGKKLGGTLIPFINQFHGDLPGLIKEMQRLGLTMSQEDANAADDFGDQMVILEKQLAGVKRTLGKDLMPVFMDFATNLSEWLIENKTEVKDWALTIAESFQSTILFLEQLGHGFKFVFGKETWDEYGKAVDQIEGKKQFGLSRSIDVGGQHRVWDPETNTFITPPTAPKKAPTNTGEYTDQFDLAKKEKFKLSPAAQALVKAAQKIGISPLDYATIIGFETAGTYSTSITNKQGYFGLIQFGSEQANKSGAYKGQSFEGQLEAANKYFIDRFKGSGKTLAGASLLDLYRTVLGGNPNASLTGKDANGVSPMSGVARMLRDNRPAALAKFFGGKESNIPNDKWGAEFKKANDEADQDTKKRYDHWNKMVDDLAAKQEKYDAEQERSYQEQADLRDKIHEKWMDDLEKEIQKEGEKAKALQDQLDIQMEQLKAHVRAPGYDAEGNETTRVGKHGEVQSIDDQTEAVQRLSDAWEGLKQKMEEAGGSISGTLTNLGALGLDFFDSMAQGVGSAIEQWAMYGGSVGEALKKALAAELAHVAGVATVNAIYAAALGFLRLAEHDYPGAVSAFTSAGIWALIAGGSALGAKALGGGGKKSGAGASGGSHGSAYSSSTANQTPYSRVSDDAYLSGSRNGLIDAIHENTAATRDLHGNIRSMRAGDVLTVGARQKPNFIAKTMVKETGSSPQHMRKMLGQAGFK